MKNNNYQIGEEITVKVFSKKNVLIDTERKQVSFWLGFNQRGIIPFEELGTDVKAMPYEILALFDFEFKAIVIASMEDEENKATINYYLSRELYNKKIIKKICEGQIYLGVITSIAPWGIFVKIEYGITVFVHCTQVSRSRIDELQKCFMHGDVIKIKILEKRYENGKYRIYGSRKLASDDIKPVLGELLPVMITGYIEYSAYFCEVTPGQKGIIHVKRGEEYSVGDKTYGYLTEIEKEGFCLRQF